MRQRLPTRLPRGWRLPSLSMSSPALGWLLTPRRFVPYYCSFQITHCKHRTVVNSLFTAPRLPALLCPSRATVFREAGREIRPSGPRLQLYGKGARCQSTMRITMSILNILGYGSLETRRRQWIRLHGQGWKHPTKPGYERPWLQHKDCLCPWRRCLQGRLLPNCSECHRGGDAPRHGYHKQCGRRCPHAVEG